MTAAIVRIFLAGFLVAMFSLAILYLHNRSLTPMQLAIWVLLAQFLPALEPFFIILSHPGEPCPRTGFVRTSQRR
jgi:hypothetical protein